MSTSKRRRLDNAALQDRAHAAARLLGEKAAAVMMAGRQPGRLFTMAEVDKAAKIACGARYTRPYQDSFRRGLCAALPASMVAMEGSG